MEILNKIVYVLMLLTALGIVVLVLLQHGKGADMGTGFGAGSSGSLFGASGSANFLSRSTAVLASIFFACTLALAYMASHRAPKSSESIDTLPAQNLPALPAVPMSDTLPPASAVPAQTAPAPAKANEIPK